MLLLLLLLRRLLLRDRSSRHSRSSRKAVDWDFRSRGKAVTKLACRRLSLNLRRTSVLDDMLLLLLGWFEARCPLRRPLWLLDIRRCLWRVPPRLVVRESIIHWRYHIAMIHDHRASQWSCLHSLRSGRTQTGQIQTHLPHTINWCCPRCDTRCPSGLLQLLRLRLFMHAIMRCSMRNRCRRSRAHGR